LHSPDFGVPLSEPVIAERSSRYLGVGAMDMNTSTCLCHTYRILSCVCWRVSARPMRLHHFVRHPDATNDFIEVFLAGSGIETEWSFQDFKMLEMTA